ncbi:hypothetical protein B7494_g3171 [Chlorociboria aeruginascens]|nr:hypothetical protein B7494_g3171 [Chlorociboria aeruginascens]
MMDHGHDNRHHHGEEMDGVETTGSGKVETIITPDERRVLDLYSKLEELQFEIERLKANGVLSRDQIEEPSNEDLKTAQLELLEARAAYSVRTRIIENVLIANPILNAVHASKTATIVEQDLLPLIEQRDQLSIKLNSLSSKVLSAQEELTKVETEHIITARKNIELAEKMLALAKDANTQEKDDIEDPAVRRQLDELEESMKVSRQKWRIMKGTASAAVVGSGVDWARDPKLLEIVLSNDDIDEGLVSRELSNPIKVIGLAILSASVLLSNYESYTDAPRWATIPGVIFVKHLKVSAYLDHFMKSQLKITFSIFDASQPPPQRQNNSPNTHSLSTPPIMEGKESTKSITSMDQNLHAKTIAEMKEFLSHDRILQYLSRKKESEPADLKAESECLTERLLDARAKFICSRGHLVLHLGDSIHKLSSKALELPHQSERAIEVERKSFLDDFLRQMKEDECAEDEEDEDKANLPNRKRTLEKGPGDTTTVDHLSNDSAEQKDASEEGESDVEMIAILQRAAMAEKGKRAAKELLDVGNPDSKSSAVIE